MKKFTLLYLFLISFTLTSCASVGIMREKYTDPEVLPKEILCPPEQAISWEEIRPGFHETDFIIEEINVKWACVRVDLETPGITFSATPNKKQLRHRFFLKNVSKGSTVSVNTTPFDLTGRTYIPVSVVKIDGETVCPVNPAYCALCLNKETKRAEILPTQNEKIDEYDYAFGGFYSILENGEIKEFAKYKRSRTACGISGEGRYLYLFATCGINCPTGRNGLNFEECAIILQALGCTNAMEFDGGHSTGLTVNGKNKIRPSLQRKVPATFSIY